MIVKLNIKLKKEESEYKNVAIWPENDASVLDIDG